MDINLTFHKKLKLVVYSDTVQCFLSNRDKGIVLGSVETNELFTRISSLIEDSEVAWINTPDERIVHYHLGYGTYASVCVFGGRTYCDIRRWWLSPKSLEVTPTTTGVVLNLNDIELLKDIQRTVIELFPSPIEPCNCGYIHHCRRCRPFDNESRGHNTEQTSRSKSEKAKTNQEIIQSRDLG